MLYYVHGNITNTDSVLQNSNFLLQIATPLAYNFTIMLKINDSSLQEFIGNTDIVPFFCNLSKMNQFIKKN